MKKRTPRNFDGTSVPGKKIYDLLPEIMNRFSPPEVELKEALSNEWQNLLGKQMSSFTEVEKFVEGILTVKVKSATLYSLLCQHEKPRLLRQLKKKFPVRDLVFRVG